MRHQFKQHFYLLKYCLYLFGLITPIAVINAGELNTSPTVLAETEIIQIAADLQLAKHEGWLALLHYKQEMLSRQVRSQADDKRFFLGKNGDVDSHAELMANITGFLRGPESNHVQCRFPARWWWLKQQIKTLSHYDVRCPLLEAFMSRMAHDKLYLVFPTMYLNNPGSTFGHTFLRFDKDDAPVLLSQTVNYAARVDKKDSLLTYVQKGIFGGYKGIFKARNYFETVQEYNDIENRDIWEYQLSFTKQEIEQLVRHVWEVKNIDFDYYFFRENCAYRLLALLDVARPGAQLTSNDNFLYYAIPVDIVRALDDGDLIVNRQFRASLATTINDYFSNKNNVKLAMEIVSLTEHVDKETIKEVIDVLDAVQEKLDVLENSHSILQFYGDSSSQKSMFILQLINELSLQLTVKNREVNLLKISPEKGHDSMRVAASYGEQNDSQYIDLKFRPAFHDLIDSPEGYIDGAAINIFDVRFKYFENERLKIESISFVNVTSLSPLTQWRNPVSWFFDISFDRSPLSQTHFAENFIGRGGIGISARQEGLMPTLLLTGEWDLSSDYDKGFSFLLGVQFGLRFNYKMNQFVLNYEVADSIAGFDYDKRVTEFQWQHNLEVNHAIRFVYDYSDYDLFNDKDWTLGYHYYF